jgi:hypothetical protein
MKPKYKIGEYTRLDSALLIWLVALLTFLAVFGVIKPNRINHLKVLEVQQIALTPQQIELLRKLDK